MAAIIENGFLGIHDIIIIYIIVLETVIKIIITNTFVVVLKHLIYRVTAVSQR